MKKLLAVLLLCLSFAASAATMSKEEFTRYFVERVEAAVKGLHLRVVQPLQLSGKDAKGIEMTAFLGNAYTQYSANPDALDKIVGDQINAIKAQQDTADTKSTSAIFAIVKPADYIANAKRQLAQAGVKGDELPLVFEKINDDLYAFYAFDTETGMRMLTKKDLADNKLALQDLRAIAVRNMSAYFDKKGVKFRRLENTGGARLYAVSLDDNYEASILFLQKFWNKQNFDVQGEPVAFVPARNLVIVTGSGDADGLRLAGYVAAKGYKELGYAISPRGYVYREGNWRPFAP